MKKYVLEFVHRGLIVAAGGPIVLAIIYGILDAVGAVESLSGGEVCKGILSITVLAFIAAGITTVYQVEQLPLFSAIVLHAGVLYLGYLIVYLINNWLAHNWTAFWIFTAIFVVGYALIWIGIYCYTKTKTEKLNRKLREGT